MLPGCSVLDRVDVTIQWLDTANNLLLRTNDQIATMSKQMVDTQVLLVESNRLVVESTKQLQSSIKNVVQSNARMDVSDANMANSNANMELPNENMTKTPAGGLSRKVTCPDRAKVPCAVMAMCRPSSINRMMVNQRLT